MQGRTHFEKERKMACKISYDKVGVCQGSHLWKSNLGEMKDGHVKDKRRERKEDILTSLLIQMPYHLISLSLFLSTCYKSSSPSSLPPWLKPNFFHSSMVLSIFSIFKPHKNKRKHELIKINSFSYVFHDIGREKPRIIIFLLLFSWRRNLRKGSWQRFSSKFHPSASFGEGMDVLLIIGLDYFSKFLDRNILIILLSSL